jgi:hypothetical protein
MQLAIAQSISGNGGSEAGTCACVCVCVRMLFVDVDVRFTAVHTSFWSVISRLACDLLDVNSSLSCANLLISTPHTHTYIINLSVSIQTHSLTHYSTQHPEEDYDPATILRGWGRIMEIVTRRERDAEWEYECACVWVGGSGANHAESAQVPLPTEQWRCRNCTLKTPTVWSAINPVDVLQCRECARPLQECGRCVWMRYEDLPSVFQEQVDTQYSPEIQKILRTAFPSLRVHLSGVQELPL